MEVAHRYIGVRVAAGYSEFRSPRSLDRLLAYLLDVVRRRRHRLLCRPRPDVWVDRFRAHLLSERGLRPNGAASYVASVPPVVARGRARRQLYAPVAAMVGKFRTGERDRGQAQR